MTTHTTDRLAVFLYLLLRDEVSFGVVERILQDVEKARSHEVSEETVFAYAESIAKRLIVRTDRPRQCGRTDIHTHAFPSLHPGDGELWSWIGDGVCPWPVGKP